MVVFDKLSNFTNLGEVTLSVYNFSGKCLFVDSSFSHIWQWLSKVPDNVYNSLQSERQDIYIIIAEKLELLLNLRLLR